jgi:hypothetical protein
MPEPTHHSYMLRLWRERSEAPWRVTLLAVAQPEERRQFDTLEDCFAYLRQQAGKTSHTTDKPNHADCISSQTD